MMFYPGLSAATVSDNAQDPYVAKFRMRFCEEIPRVFASYDHLRNFKGTHARQLAAFRRAGLSVALDSGAFTATRAGRRIVVEDYAAFLRFSTDPFDFAITLDDMSGRHDSWSRTLVNFEKLRDYGQETVPVLRIGDPPEAFAATLELKPKMIAFGGLVGVRTEGAIAAWLDWAWQRVIDEDGRPLVPIHGLGINNPLLMTRYPWYSVDSTSWVMRASYGWLWPEGTRRNWTVHVTERKEHVPGAASIHYTALNQTDRRVVDRQLEEAGLTYDLVRQSHCARAWFNLWATMRLEQLAPERYRPTINESVFMEGN